MQKSDLDQIGKLVRKIVREEVETEIGNTKDSIEHEITTSNLHVRGEIQELSGRMKNVEIKLNNVDNRLSGVEKEVKGSRKDIKKLQKDVSVLIKTSNEEDVRLAKRVRKIEEHLNLPQN